MKRINIGLIGLGTVGSGVIDILRKRGAILKEKIKAELFLKKICDKDVNRLRAIGERVSIKTADPKEILDDPNIDVVIELIGGIHPAKEYIMEAIKKGKHVVTANKYLLACEGREIFNFAKTYSKNIYFEASVCAGIPLIKAIREGLVANRFLSIFGILNGTTNFILSRMSESGESFSKALEEAKRRGYAEKDPSLDIQGIDSAHKLAILAYLAFGRFIDLKDIFIEGISDISLLDIRYAQELKLAIKLLAIAKKTKDLLELRVHPTLIPYTHPLSSVKGIFNAVYVQTDLAGELLFYGEGAGKMSAASAVISDLVDSAKDIRAGLFRPTLNVVSDPSIKRLQKISDIKSHYYIRFMAKDLPGVLAKISGILGKYRISIASVTQKERKRAKVVPIVMITHQTDERSMQKALEKISHLAVVKEKPVVIRIEEML
jgi:homoserine dehydrogenase